jgi:hypothetical protein
MGGLRIDSTGAIEKALSISSKVEGVRNMQTRVVDVMNASSRYARALKPGREVPVLNPGEVFSFLSSL